MFTISFRLRVDGEWRLIDDCEAADILTFYTQLDGLHCCDMQGGFFISIDGTAWTDQSTVDEFWFTMTWFEALIELLSGNDHANAHPWEEAALTLVRNANNLIMEDVHHSGTVVSPRVIVPFMEFAEQMLLEGKKFIIFIESLRNLIHQASGQGRSSEIKQKHLTILGNLPEKGESLLQDLEKKLRQLQLTTATP